MRPNETFDEAIDRVATRMTVSSGGDIVWTPPTPASWFGWRLAGGISVFVMLLGIAFVSLSRPGPQHSTTAIETTALTVWASLRTPIGPSPAGSHADAGRRALERQTGALETRPSWGIPLIERPPGLAVSDLAMREIPIEHIGVEAIEVAPLSIGNLDRDAETIRTKEQ